MQRALLVLALGVVVAACGSSGSGSSNQPSPHTLSGRVLTEVVSGGFVPSAEAFFEELPAAAVFADGRMFTVKRASDNAALLTLVERTLPVSAVDRLVDQARAAGVRKPPPDVGRPGVTDNPTTAFTLSADGATTTVDVYALDFTGGLTPSQIAARKRIQTFSDQLSRVGTGSGPGTRPRAYVPGSLSVLVNTGEGPAPSPLPRSGPTVRWPLPAFQPSAAGCVAVVGKARVRRVLPLAMKATTGTVWLVSGQRLHLIFRPDLPDTKPCTLG